MDRFQTDRRRLLAGGAAGALASFLPASLLHAQPNEGKTLTIVLPSNPITMDPINQLNHDAMVLGQTVFENLVEYDVDGVLKPQLAKALPTISADKKTYVFELRDDVMFQNGKKMTAEDVKYSFDYLLDPENKAARRSLFTRIAKVTALAPDKVQFDLSEPYGPWLYFLTKYMGIFPAGSRKEHGDDYFKSRPAGVGTGFGIFEEWKPNDYISFKKNPNYWRKGLPHWDRLVVKMIPEDATRVAYLLTGQVDIISAPPPREFNKLKDMPGVTGASRPTLGGALLMFTNNLKPPLDDVNFRKAISAALDRKVIGDKVYYGLLDPTSVPAPPRGWWYNAEADKELGFNLDRAKEFLAKSKYPTGAEVDLSIQAEPYLLDTKDAAIFVQSQLAKIGIKVNLKVYEFSVLIQQIARGEHQMALQVFMSPGEASYIVQVTLTPGQVLSKSTGYDNPELTGLLSAAFAETDQAKLKDIYGKIQSIVARDAPIGVLGYVHASNLWRDRVKDFKVNQGLTMYVGETKV
ncbi:MAG: ABC transporter substrate-binding protein [Chelatococcus sp.]|jgi:peptide/nickel transport system substrate-binding protein|uniref:ABC transporter substrate-binding protein n=1 Tax=unclassified Chelatococcus TaxID=2638111 RepID=UPI001BCCE8FE|nr:MULTISPECIES: ABC transporter substrate-binding protein [unclassified Chelatococcus]CAH1658994.1 Peptide/nickel transport system substrate-binding protein [Hyphomicrobiales bacterium]MBS7740876.1 ABC transporter substrate-binding protein [Chelatococcus sp. HY11]MBX3540006.1 ABC transporter substrate-binding protein [Chelatococcus sp.]MBX3546833.1 ABC transporter substrate-binding protein [Chelatococcus sp.]MCO5079962.1 ABC transporter substrate-binding protein [Chelatococcus sp.]